MAAPEKIPAEESRKTSGTLRARFAAAALFWLNLCIFFVGLNLIAALALRLLAPPQGEDLPPIIDEALHKVYAGRPEADLVQLARESRIGFSFEPYSMYRETAASGRFINIDQNGFRHSRNQGPWPPDKRSFNIFVFGSSSTFGYGVSDDDTIASYLQQLLSKVGLPREPRVYNFGRGGYYSTQERILFEQLAVAGNVPDLAVFVDGGSDFIFAQRDRPFLSDAFEHCIDRNSAAPSSGFAAAVSDLPLVRLLDRYSPRQESADMNLAASAPKVKRAPYDDPDVAREVFRHYIANMRLTSGAASGVGATAAFVWQPVPLYRYDLSYHVHRGNYQSHEYSRHGYPRVAEYVRTHEMGREFLWCADIQEGVKELLYVDQNHYSPAMSERVASCIATKLCEHELIPCAQKPAAERP